MGSPWRDDSSANSQLVAFARAVRPGVDAKEMRQILSGYSQLTLKTDGNGRRWRVATPGRMFADNWIAWLYFRSDGSLLAIRFGTDDFSGPVDRPKGMPDDLCFGARDECARAMLI
jgi:hypothetical protein